MTINGVQQTQNPKTAAKITRQVYFLRSRYLAVGVLKRRGDGIIVLPDNPINSAITKY